MPISFPEEFIRLHQGEEEVRAKAIALIESSADLCAHARMVKQSADLIYHFVHKDQHCDEDDLTIRLIGIRVFSALNASLSQMLAGYYQSAAAQIRDLMETFFLLDLLGTDRSLIKEWREADDTARWNKFRPSKVREALDKRDEISGGRRGAEYKMLSDLAGHPSPHGFRLYRLPDGSHHCGPYFEEKVLDATLAELAKAATQSGVHCGFLFEPVTRADYQMKLSYMEAQNVWFMRFFWKPIIEQTVIDEMSAQLECVSF